MPEIQPHQQRVIDEKTELDDKISKLGTFIESNAFFPKLPPDERRRLTAQQYVMEQYSYILAARISAFQ